MVCSTVMDPGRQRLPADPYSRVGSWLSLSIRQVSKFGRREAGDTWSGAIVLDNNPPASTGRESGVKAACGVLDTQGLAVRGWLRSTTRSMAFLDGMTSDSGAYMWQGQS
jgi:hypothetical protein